MGRTLQGAVELPHSWLTTRHPTCRDRTAHQLWQTLKDRDQEGHHDPEEWEGCRTRWDTSRSHQSRHRDSRPDAIQPLQQDLGEGGGTLGEPFQVNTVIGDGNCLCRALSLEVVGTQNYHEQFRAKIVDFILQNPSTFEGYVGTLAITFWSIAFRCALVELMHRFMLQQHFSRQVLSCTHLWMRPGIQHLPLFSIPSIVFSQENIYLRNLCGHFERVVSVR